jgi:hypothetical protein
MPKSRVRKKKNKSSAKKKQNEALAFESSKSSISFGRDRSLMEVLHQTNNEAAIQRFLQYSLTTEDLEFIKKSANDILLQTPVKAFHCAAMSAAWGAMIEDHSSIPIAVVTGTLKYGKTNIFLGDRALPIGNESAIINEIWDGHCWIEMPGMVADISIFRTIKNAAVPKHFADHLLNSFGASAGLLCASPDTLARYNLFYEPMYSLSTVQINGLINGAYP